MTSEKEEVEENPGVQISKYGSAIWNGVVVVVVAHCADSGV
jgi:hypothetical protein